MKRYRSMLSIAYLCLSLAAASRAQSQPSSTPAASASIPRLIRFSGNVKDDAGHPRGGVVGITFALYKDEQGGAPLWLETQNVQADAKGTYAVLLGSTNPKNIGVRETVQGTPSAEQNPATPSNFAKKQGDCAGATTDYWFSVLILL